MSGGRRVFPLLKSSPSACCNSSSLIIMIRLTPSTFFWDVHVPSPPIHTGVRKGPELGVHLLCARWKHSSFICQSPLRQCPRHFLTPLSLTLSQTPQFTLAHPQPNRVQSVERRAPAIRDWCHDIRKHQTLAQRPQYFASVAAGKMSANAVYSDLTDGTPTPPDTRPDPVKYCNYCYNFNGVSR